MTESRRDAEREAVARWLYEHDAEFLIRSGWDTDNEGLKAYYYEQAAALDAVRSPQCTCDNLFGTRDRHAAGCPLAVRSPQGEDHERFPVTAEGFAATDDRTGPAGEQSPGWPQGEDHEAGIEAAMRAFDDGAAGGFDALRDEKWPERAMRQAIAAYLSRWEPGSLAARMIEESREIGEIGTASLLVQGANTIERLRQQASSPERDTEDSAQFWLRRAQEQEARAKTAECDTERLVEALSNIAATSTDDATAEYALRALAEFEGSDAKPPESRVSQGE